VSESASYYVLGIERPAPRANGRDQEVEVRVRNKDLRVVSRRTIGGTRNTAGRSEASSRAAGTPPTSLEAALAAVAPASEIRMAASAVAFRGNEPAAPSVVLVLTDLEPPITSRPGSERVLQFLAGSWDRNGTAVVTHAETLAVTGGTAVEVATRLALPKGRHEIRVAAEDGTSHESGSVFTFVDVPDFAKERLSLSGLLVAAGPAPPLASADAFKGLLPIAPTALRVFTRTSKVVAFVRAYQGGDGPPRDVTMAATLVGVDGPARIHETTTLAGGRFAETRSTDYFIQMPVDELSPGPYLLTLEASLDDRRAARYMRFEVK